MASTLSSRRLPYCASCLARRRFVGAESTFGQRRSASPGLLVRKHHVSSWQSSRTLAPSLFQAHVDSVLNAPATASGLTAYSEGRFSVGNRHYSSSKLPEATRLTPARLPEVPLDTDPSFWTRNQPEITLTPRGQAQLSKLCKNEANPNLALRLAVEPGGCHGYQYHMEVVDMESKDEDEGIEQEDFLFTSPGQEFPAHVLIDSTSLTLLNGSMLDYATELIGSQFVIRDNPNAKGAGCGCGVSWEPKDGVGLGGDASSVQSSVEESAVGSPGLAASSPSMNIDIGAKGQSSRRPTSSA